MRPDTRCVHAGKVDDDPSLGVATPIYPSTAHLFPNAKGEMRYPRLSNTPTQKAVAEKLCALEGGEEALVLCSGMSAISTVMYSLLKAGDHAIFQSGLYGGTQELSGWLQRYGIELTVVSSNVPEDYGSAIRENTRLIHMESPTNPLLDVIDLGAVADLARELGALTVVDNTFATPINQTPLELGVDVVVHSGTKYLNGHSDLTSGAVVTSAKLMEGVRECAQMHGGTLDALPCYLLERGLKTLGLRVRRQTANATALADALRGHPKVRRVFYPGLPDHPGHEVAKRQMRGFGGMLSFELDCEEDVMDDVLGRFEVVTPAVSLGGVETLVCLPARTSHSWISEEERRAQGIGPTLVRMSAGIEDIDDLLEDVERVLSTL